MRINRFVPRAPEEIWLGHQGYTIVLSPSSVKHQPSLDKHTAINLLSWLGDSREDCRKLKQQIHLVVSRAARVPAQCQSSSFPAVPHALALSAAEHRCWSLELLCCFPAVKTTPCEPSCSRHSCPYPHCSRVLANNISTYHTSTGFVPVSL